MNGHQTCQCWVLDPAQGRNINQEVYNDGVRDFCAHVAGLVKALLCVPTQCAQCTRSSKISLHPKSLFVAELHKFYSTILQHTLPISSKWGVMAPMRARAAS